MTTPLRWQDPAGALKKLAAAIGLDPATLENYESPDEFDYYNAQFQTSKLDLSDDPGEQGQQLAALNDVLQEMNVKYGPALVLRFSLGSLELVANRPFTLSDLKVFCDGVKGSPFEVSLRIKKEALTSDWDFQSTTTVFKVFLFPAALNRALGVSLRRLEGGLMKGFTGEKKLMILSPDSSDIELDGNYLSILGGNFVSQWSSYVPKAMPQDALNKVQAVRHQIIEKPRWTGIELQYLTPLQLTVDWKKSTNGPAGDNPVAGGLYAQLLACSLLYLAGNARLGRAQDVAGVATNQRDYPWTFSFAGEKYSAKVEILSSEAIQAAFAANGVSTWEACNKIGDLVNWLYGERSAFGPRLGVIQVVIASALQDNPASANLGELIRRGPDLHDRILQRWNDFMEDKLGKYFLHLKELEDVVKTTTNAHNEQIQTLTKSLTDNMLAAVGVVVGSFIAAIFKSPFETYIFWIGTGIYLAYLVVFPICVGLSTAWQRFTSSHDAFKRSEREFGERLSTDEVSDIVGSVVTKSERRFISWFDFTMLTYVVVALLLLIAIFELPPAIRRWSDKFELSGLSYTKPATSEIVPMIIRGEHFDKDKEIEVKIGDAEFSNTDGKTLKVLGSTVLTLTPRQEELATARAKGDAFVSIRQGTAANMKFPLPDGPAPIPKPRFDRWVAAVGGKGSLIAYGANFDSISKIRFAGANLNFAVSSDAVKLELTDSGKSKTRWSGGTIELTLKNGELLQEPISVVETEKKQ